ncbi:MAG: 50S ribosomal protein bL37 [Acidimicrobiales bacterium]|jgi:hypothetical protein
MPFTRPRRTKPRKIPNATERLAAHGKKYQRGRHYTVPLVSKRTVKRKLRKKKKANHGKKPNCGRG